LVGKTPSELLNVPALERELTGFRGENVGWWASWQLDSPVLWLGAYVEAKTSEYDQEAQRYRYTLEDLLAHDKSAENVDAQVQRLIQLFGVEHR